MSFHPAHTVAIFGGAVSGAEAAEYFSRLGIYTVVFEQNALPYGKIEDGLPKWHVKLRDKEEAKINEKLDHPYVQYVPNCRLGSDVAFEDIVQNWGFSAVMLATGAWNDRPLPIDGIDAYVGKGLYYQNPFIYWFNHFHEKAFDGEQMTFADDAIVVGGGLASVDVVKALMVLTVAEALEKRGINVDLFSLEKYTPAKALAEHNLTMADLGLKGCTLYYRREAKYMPLTPIPDGADERRINKAYEVRERMVNNLQERFLFTFEPCHMPVDKIVENDQLVGLKLQKTRIENGRVLPIPDAFVEKRSPLVISSIGSIPELLPGVPSKGSVFDIESEETGKIRGCENVFALGNAVTGRGNIKESRIHGAQVARATAADFLQWDEDKFTRLREIQAEDAAAQAAAIAKDLAGAQLKSVDEINATMQRVQAAQKQAGYEGNYSAWVEARTPERYEDQIGEH